MIVLSVQDIAKSFGIDSVLSNITFSLQNGEHMGLIGTNGSGKTTLLKIICGEVLQDSGFVHLSKENKLGYLAQNNDMNPNKSIWDSMLELFAEAIDLENKISELELQMENCTDDDESIRLANNYHRVCDRFNAIQGYAYKGEITGVLNGLGFTDDQFSRLSSSFSGGEKTRLSLAKILLQKPEIILMDEPTNHLDFASIEWLEGYLNQYRGALIVISHDRYFLDHVCNSIGEISFGKIYKYSGNYTQYQKKRSIEYEAELKAYEQQQKLIDRENSIIAKYRSFNREKSIKAAESRQKRLDKLDILNSPKNEKQIHFSFEAKLRSGEDVIKIENLSKAYDNKQLFKNIGLQVQAGDRIALIGQNGIGKSTLFNIIMHIEEADTGYSAFGANVDPGYYEQQHRHLNTNKTVLDEVWDRFPNYEQYQVRGALGRFLFVGDDVFKPINKLSGGERARVALAILMLQKNNLLLLDEPTNHLDVESREVLEDALVDYKGTIIAISHDRYFINRFANKVLVMEDNGISEYLGNYDDYIEKKNRPKEPESVGNTQTKTEMQKLKRKTKLEKQRLYSIENDINIIENKISLSETRCKELEITLADPTTYKEANTANELHSEYTMEKQKQNTLFNELEELYMQLELQQ